MGRPAVDMTGVVVGRLTALRRGPDFGVGTTRMYTTWICKCACGKEKIIRTTALRKRLEPTKSCGCAMSGPAAIAVHPNSAMRNTFSRYKTHARTAKRPFSLSIGEFAEMTQRNCHYCGAKPGAMTVQPLKLGKSCFIYNGIDRIDNTQGYVAGNVVTCCWMCNHSKGARTVEAFTEWLDRIAAHRAATVTSAQPGV